jgi:hypothetical protein
MERDSNKMLTAAVCLGAAVISIIYFLKAQAKQRKEHQVSSQTKEISSRAGEAGDSHLEHAFHQAIVNSHITKVHTMREWCDASFGVKFQFAPQTLRPILEERQYPVIHIKFSVVNEHNLVSVVIEECRDVTSLDEYREICLARLELCAKILPCEPLKSSGTELRTLSYQFTNERDCTVTVLAVLQKDSSRYVTIQHQTIGDRCAVNARSVLGDLVRSVKFLAPMTTPSYLFCTEPRHGVGMKLPLCLTFIGDDGVNESDSSHVSSSFPLAHFTGQAGLTVVARYERYAPSRCSIREAMLKVMHQAKARYSLRKHLVPAESGRPKSSDEIPVTTMVQNKVTAGDDEGVQRANECFFFVADCPVDSFGDAGGVTSALLCVYLYNVLSEYVSVSFFTPKSGSSSLQSFLPLCTAIGDSLTVGNHYGQETTVVYCNRRFTYPFDIRLGSQWTVWEPPLGDPLCIVSVLGVNLQEVDVRAVSCPHDVLNDVGKFQRECWQQVLQLPARVSIHSSEVRPRRGGLVSFDIVFSELAIGSNESEGDVGQDAGSNPFSRCSCPHPSRDSNPATPRDESMSLRIVVVLCTGEGLAFLLHVATTAYYQQESKRVIDEVAAHISLVRAQ